MAVTTSTATTMTQQNATTTPEVEAALVELLATVEEGRLDVQREELISGHQFEALYQLLFNNKVNKNITNLAFCFLKRNLIFLIEKIIYDRVGAGLESLTFKTDADEIKAAWEKAPSWGETPMSVKFLKSFNLVCDYIDSDIIKFFTYNRLTSLSLSAKLFEPETIPVLAEALKTNETLISLSLNIEDPSRFFTKEDSKALATMLETNKTLNSLRLRGRFGVEGNNAIEIFDALKTNNTLCFLSFEGAHIGAHCATPQSIKDNTTLTSLEFIDNNVIGQEYLFAQFIRFGKALTSLNLRNTSLNLRNSHEIRLNLIAISLKTNTTLTSLDLRYNQLHWAPDLVDAVRTNTGLMEVLVDEEIPESADIKTYCGRNRRLHRNWGMVSVILSNDRANRGHTFMSSILPLLPTIRELAGMKTEPTDICSTQDPHHAKASRFRNTEYAKAIIYGMKAKTAATVQVTPPAVATTNTSGIGLL